MQKVEATTNNPQELKEMILEAGKVSKEIKEKFFSGKKFSEIRDILESMGLDRHTAIELYSTEIALVTPFGVLMQIRPTDKNQLGMWGGVLEDGENIFQGAQRELFEETGLEIHIDEFKFVEVNKHFHQYDNGDKVYFETYRFKVEIDHVPTITTDEESVGAFMVVHTILDHQQDFIKRILGEK